MSAWYVFSAMGFYPVDPVGGKYEIGTPLYPEMKMHLPVERPYGTGAGGEQGKLLHSICQTQR